MQNGTRKGGSVPAYQIMRSSPGLEDIWQLHWSYSGGIEHNPAGVFIANVDDAGGDRQRADVTTGTTRGNPPAAASGGQAPPAQGAVSQPAHSPAYYLKISAQDDGSFTVTNTRNGFTKTYPRRRTT